MRLALTLLILSFAASPVLAQDPSQDAATQMQQQMRTLPRSNKPICNGWPSKPTTKTSRLTSGFSSK
jgi:hypothetical protein